MTKQLQSDSGAVLSDETVSELYRQAQVGMCVNSVTHDVNNLLGAVMAYSELIALDQSLDSESQRMLNDMMEAIRKSSALMGNLTAIAREEKPTPRLVKVPDFIETVLSVLRYELNLLQIDPKIHADGESGYITVDEPKLFRGLLYLVMNAAEATEGQGQRRIEITVQNTSDAVEVALWNNGPPLDETQAERAFEPFHTTKSGRHMGLGLTEARRFAEIHQGELVYDAERGFVLRLPLDNGLESGQIG